MMTSHKKLHPLAASDSDEQLNLGDFLLSQTLPYTWFCTGSEYDTDNNTYSNSDSDKNIIRISDDED